MHSPIIMMQENPEWLSWARQACFHSVVHLLSTLNGKIFWKQNIFNIQLESEKKLDAAVLKKQPQCYMWFLYVCQFKMLTSSYWNKFSFEDERHSYWKGIWKHEVNYISGATNALYPIFLILLKTKNRFYSISM